VTIVRAIVEADGGARGNPGPAGYGAVVRDPLTGEALVERSASLPPTTNNVAEYSGLIAGLAAAADLGAREVIVRMDSRLVVEQMSGRWKIKHPGLRPLAAQAAALVRRFDRVEFEWVPRERNAAADALANQAMDAAAAESPNGESSERIGGSGSWEPRADEPTRMLLVRHGATAYTAEGRYSGRGDVPLSDVGIKQAQAVAHRIAGMRLDVATIITSPLSRCVQTAGAIASALGGADEPGPPVNTEADLIECDFGAWEGKTFAEVRAGWPHEMDRWFRSTSVAPPGGESFADVAVRVRRAVTMLRDAYPQKVLVVVSHVSPIKIALRDVLAAGDEFLYRLHLDPVGLSIVDLWRDGGVSVRQINDIAHLG
jgi:ribonuclease H / adenosylcobalamin/alpha-ribazole phosphatase